MSYRNVRFAVATLTALTGAIVPAAAFAQEQTPVAVPVQISELPEGDGALRMGAVGTLSVIDGAYSIERRDGIVFAFAIGDAITVKQPPSGAADVSALVDGIAVAVLLEQLRDESWIAIQTMIRPDRPTTEHLSGAVISREGNVITIIDATGREHTVELPERAAAAIEIGETLTAIADRRPDGSTRPAKGKGVVTSDEVRERLQGQVEKIRGKAERGLVDAATAERDIANALARLETNQARVADVLGKALERVPEQARARIEAARSSVNDRFEEAKARVSEARDSAGRERAETAGRSERETAQPRG